MDSAAAVEVFGVAEALGAAAEQAEVGKRNNSTDVCTSDILCIPSIFNLYLINKIETRYCYACYILYKTWLSAL